MDLIAESEISEEESIFGEEEIEISEEEKRNMLIQAITFMSAVLKQNPKRGIIGTMDCPLCKTKGSVSYTRSTYNGHLHAGCSACSVGVME